MIKIKLKLCNYFFSSFYQKRYRGDHVINYSQRGGISVVTEKQTRTSRLLISRALPADSGNYTCSPSAADSASVLVHVLNGELIPKSFVLIKNYIISLFPLFSSSFPPLSHKYLIQNTPKHLQFTTQQQLYISQLT